MSESEEKRLSASEIRKLPQDQRQEIMSASVEKAVADGLYAEDEDCYQNPVEALREIHNNLENLEPNDPDDGRATFDYKRGFLEGRAFEITSEMEEHPEFWVRVCNCDKCGDRA